MHQLEGWHVLYIFAVRSLCSESYERAAHRIAAQEKLRCWEEMLLRASAAEISVLEKHICEDK